MSRLSVHRAFLAFGLSALLLLGAFVYAEEMEDIDGNTLCPDESFYVYDSSMDLYAKTRDGKVNLYGKMCVSVVADDKAGEGKCTAASFCEVNICDGKPCKLPSLTLDGVNKILQQNDTVKLEPTQPLTNPNDTRSVFDSALFDPTPIKDQGAMMSPSGSSVMEQLQKSIDSEPSGWVSSVKTSVSEKWNSFFSSEPLSQSKVELSDGAIEQSGLIQTDAIYTGGTAGSNTFQTDNGNLTEDQRANIAGQFSASDSTTSSFTESMRNMVCNFAEWCSELNEAKYNRDGYVVTAYGPQYFGWNAMQGGAATSKPGLDGEFSVRTLEDVRKWQESGGTEGSPYVTLATHPSNNGKFYDLGTVGFKSDVDGKWVELKEVVGYSHDTGSAFREVTCEKYGTCSVMHQKIDIAEGRYASNAQAMREITQNMPTVERVATLNASEAYARITGTVPSFAESSNPAEVNPRFAESAYGPSVESVRDINYSGLSGVTQVEQGADLPDITPIANRFPTAEWDPNQYTAEAGQRITAQIIENSPNEVAEATQLADRLQRAEVESNEYVDRELANIPLPPPVDNPYATVPVETAELPRIDTGEGDVDFIDREPTIPVEARPLDPIQNVTAIAERERIAEQGAENTRNTFTAAGQKISGWYQSAYDTVTGAFTTGPADVTEGTLSDIPPVPAEVEVSVVTAAPRDTSLDGLAIEYPAGQETVRPDVESAARETYIDSQIPVPDFTQPTAKEIMADIRESIAASEPSFLTRVQTGWNNLFGSTDAGGKSVPLDGPIAESSGADTRPQTVIPYSRPSLTTAELLGIPEPLPASWTIPVTSQDLPPARDTSLDDFAIEFPGGEQEVRPDVANALDPYNPVDAFEYPAGQDTVRPEVADAARETYIDSQIPVPDIVQPTAKQIMRDIRESIAASEPSFLSRVQTGWNNLFDGGTNETPAIADGTSASEEVARQAQSDAARDRIAAQGAENTRNTFTAAGQKISGWYQSAYDTVTGAFTTGPADVTEGTLSDIPPVPAEVEVPIIANALDPYNPVDAFEYPAGQDTVRPEVADAARETYIDSQIPVPDIVQPTAKQIMRDLRESVVAQEPSFWTRVQTGWSNLFGNTDAAGKSVPLDGPIADSSGAQTSVPTQPAQTPSLSDGPTPGDVSSGDAQKQASQAAPSVQPVTASVPLPRARPSDVQSVIPLPQPRPVSAPVISSPANGDPASQSPAGPRVIPVTSDPSPSVFERVTSGIASLPSSVWRGLGQVVGQMFFGSNQATQQSAPGTTPASPTSPTSTAPGARPVVSLIANPSSVEMGGTSALAWASIGTTGCNIFAPQQVQIATGTPDGRVQTARLATTSVFVAECSTALQEKVYATTTVIVK